MEQIDIRSGIGRSDRSDLHAVLLLSRELIDLSIIGHANLVAVNGAQLALIGRVSHGSHPVRVVVSLCRSMMSLSWSENIRQLADLADARTDTASETLRLG